MGKKESESYEVVEIPTETEPRIRNNETKETYTLMEAINLILNEVKEIKRAVG